MSAERANEPADGRDPTAAEQPLLAPTRGPFTWRRRDRLRRHINYNLWAVPVLFAVAGMALGVLLPALDRSTEISFGLDWDPGAAQVALGAIVAGTITLVGFVYTITLLVLQLQFGFSPRLIRVLMRDPSPKLAVGVLTGSAIFALGVLRAIDGEFVPQLSTTGALLGMAASIILFLFIVGRLTSDMRTSRMISRVGRLTRPVIAELYPERGSPGDPGRAAERPDEAETRAVTHAREPGVVIGVDVAGALRLASAADTVLFFEPAIGEFVHTGSTLFRLDDRETPIADAELRELVQTGSERSFEQDPQFGLRLLVDMASSALSPAVNDPTTAVQALDELDDLLRMLAPRRLQVALRGVGGAPRLYYAPASWEDYVGLACNEPRHYGVDQPQVARRMRAMLEDLLELVPSFRRPALERQLKLLESSVTRAFSDPDERAIAEVPDRLGMGQSRAAGAGTASRSAGDRSVPDAAKQVREERR